MYCVTRLRIHSNVLQCCKVLQCKTCKTLSYEVFELINSNSVCFNLLNATYNVPDVEVVDVDNDVPSIIL